jgi:hypothetical protein
MRHHISSVFSKFIRLLHLQQCPFVTGGVINRAVCIASLLFTCLGPVQVLADAVSDAASRNQEVSVLFTAGDLRGADALAETIW